MRRQRHSGDVGELLLVGAVVIHLPDFFGAAAITDEVNLGFRNALDAYAETEDDFVGEAVGDEAGVVFGGLLAVLLAEYLGRLRILYVIQPALHYQRPALRGGVAECQHTGVRGWVAPLRKINFLRRARVRQRIKARRDHIKDAGRLQVVPQGDTE